ncbi:MAG TPA: WYL domain-containing protein [Planctomycetota bacterium]|jgi:proteasome accessory factor C|nr:WYL domain-containing protein [Planctomycetota bacterium]
MSSMALDRIRRCLAMVPLIRARPGIRLGELALMFGVTEAEIRADITDVLALCGVPPYLPHNYFVFQIAGDRVRIRFAEHLRRPVHLTLQEALAIDLALRGVGSGRAPPFGDAAARLREKLRLLLKGGDRDALETLDRSVTGKAPPEPVMRTIALLREAMSRNVAARIVYYTAGRDVVSEREIEPFGLVDTHGTWYVVARDSQRGRELPFRVDRIRSVELTTRGYEVPDDFTAERYRRDEMYVEGGDEVAVRVRFTERAAARATEGAPRRDVEARPDGSVVRTFRTGERARWLYALVARHGGDAEVLSPPAHRAGMAAYLDSMLDAAGEARATAAARAKPGPPRTKRRPTA